MLRRDVAVWFVLLSVSFRWLIFSQCNLKGPVCKIWLHLMVRKRPCFPRAPLHFTCFLEELCRISYWDICVFMDLCCSSVSWINCKYQPVAPLNSHIRTHVLISHLGWLLIEIDVTFRSANAFKFYKSAVWTAKIPLCITRLSVSALLEPAEQ